MNRSRLRAIYVPRRFRPKREHLDEFHRSSAKVGFLVGDLDPEIDESEDVVEWTPAALLELDPSLADAFMTPVGWTARRFERDANWHYEPETATRSFALKQGWRLGPEPSPAAVDLGCYVGGANGISGARCPNCSKPLLRVLTVETRGLVGRRLPQFRGCPEVPLLYCWRCGVSEYPFLYQVRSDGITVLRCGAGAPRRGFPYSGYPVAFPARKLLGVRIGAQDAKWIACANRGLGGNVGQGRAAEWGAPIHQIGGEPRLMQGSADWPCPTCWRPMAVLAAASDESYAGRGFTDNRFVQLVMLVCDMHPVVCVLQQCD